MTWSSRSLLESVYQMLMEEFRKDIVSCRLTMEQPCFHMSETVQQSVRNAAQKLGLAAMTMDSGAGHDSMSLSQVTRVGMIFVPSVKGISHSKEEFTTWDDVTNGANVLLHALCDIDRSGELRQAGHARAGIDLRRHHRLPRRDGGGGHGHRVSGGGGGV